MGSKDPTILPPSPVFALPSEWVLLSGEDRRSGPGYTIWRDWGQAAWIDGLLRYDSYNGGEETVPVAVVGIYLNAETSEPIGILVRKRLQDGLKDRFLVPLRRIRGMVLLGDSPLQLGESGDLIDVILDALESRREGAADASASKKNAVAEYSRSIAGMIATAVARGLDVDAAVRVRLASAGSPERA